MTNNFESQWRRDAVEHKYQRGLKKEKQSRFDNALKVYVKNIPTSDPKWQEKVRELFSDSGEVIHEHFFEKKLAEKTVPQGLLVFSSQEQAARASNVTGTVLGGRHIIASTHHQYAQHGPKTVLITNLSPDTDEEDVWRVFENYGTIKFIHIVRPLNTTSLKGEVHFKTEKGARKSLVLDGTELKGNQLSVSIHGTKDDAPSHEYPVIVQGLHHGIEKASLVEFFSGCGAIKRIKINRKHEECAHAVLYFLEKEAVENALACNGNNLAGDTISVTRHEEGILQADLQNPVFLANMARGTKDLDIFLTFQDCGLIHDIKFVQSKHGSLKKGFIEFKNEDSISKALEFSGFELKGEKLIVSTSRKVWSSAMNHESSVIQKLKRKSSKCPKNDDSNLPEKMKSNSDDLGEEKKKKKKRKHMKEKLPEED